MGVHMCNIFLNFYSITSSNKQEVHDKLTYLRCKNPPELDPVFPDVEDMVALEANNENFLYHGIGSDIITVSDFLGENINSSSNTGATTHLITFPDYAENETPFPSFSPAKIYDIGNKTNHDINTSSELTKSNFNLISEASTLPKKVKYSYVDKVKIQNKRFKRDADECAQPSTSKTQIFSEKLQSLVHKVITSKNEKVLNSNNNDQIDYVIIQTRNEFVHLLTDLIKNLIYYRVSLHHLFSLFIIRATQEKNSRSVQKKRFPQKSYPKDFSIFIKHSLNYFKSQPDILYNSSMRNYEKKENVPNQFELQISNFLIANNHELDNEKICSKKLDGITDAIKRIRWANKEVMDIKKQASFKFKDLFDYLKMLIGTSNSNSDETDLLLHVFQSLFNISNYFDKNLQIEYKKYLKCPPALYCSDFIHYNYNPALEHHSLFSWVIDWMLYITSITYKKDFISLNSSLFRIDKTPNSLLVHIMIVLTSTINFSSGVSGLDLDNEVLISNLKNNISDALTNSKNLHAHYFLNFDKTAYELLKFCYSDSKRAYRIKDLKSYKTTAENLVFSNNWYPFAEELLTKISLLVKDCFNEDDNKLK